MRAAVALLLLCAVQGMRLWPFNGAKAPPVQKWSSTPVKVHHHVEKKDVKGRFSAIKQKLRMRTKPEMIRQALGVKPGEDVTVDASRWKALLNTGIFHEIHGYYEPSPEGTVMTVHVREAPSVSIAPELSKTFGSGIACGVVVKDKNLFGMGQELSVRAKADLHRGSAGCSVSWMKRLLGSPNAVILEGDISIPEQDRSDLSTPVQKMARGAYSATLSFLARPGEHEPQAVNGTASRVLQYWRAIRPTMDNSLFVQQNPSSDSSAPSNTVLGLRNRVDVALPLGPKASTEVAIGTVSSGHGWSQFHTARTEVSTSKTYPMKFLRRLFLPPGERAPDLHIVSAGRVSAAGGPGYLARQHGSAVGGLGSARGYHHAAFGVKRALAATSIEVIASLRMFGLGVFADAAVASDRFSALPNFQQWSSAEQMRGTEEEAVCLSSIGVCLGFGPIRVDVGVPSHKHDIRNAEIGVRLLQPLSL